MKQPVLESSKIFTDNVMRKYYLMKIIYKNKGLFVIWYDDEEDGFIVEYHRLVTFESIDDAERFAEKNHILLEGGISTYDFSNAIELTDQIDDSEKCGTIINLWNFFSDLAKTLKEEFIGDSDQEQILKIYEKLFYGCNLKAIIFNTGQTIEVERRNDDKERIFKTYKRG